MLELEFKILLLTMVYFAGWFIFEKVFSAAWERWTAQPSTGSRPANRTRVPTLASVTPLDQTFRYIRGLKNPDWRVRRISRIMAELGADLIKTFYTGKRFPEVIANTPVPVFTIGADKTLQSRWPMRRAVFLHPFHV